MHLYGSSRGRRRGDRLTDAASFPPKLMQLLPNDSRCVRSHQWSGLERLPLLSGWLSMRRMITMHFRDDTNRDGEKNQDVDGCTANEVVEVNSVDEASLRNHDHRPLSTCLGVWFATKTGASEPCWPRVGWLRGLKTDQPCQKFHMRTRFGRQSNHPEKADDINMLRA